MISLQRNPEDDFTQEFAASPHKRTLKVSLVREELLELTNDPLIAMLLNQLLYWSQRVTDFDLFVAEEKSVSPKHQSSHQYGWFYKTAYELVEEAMLCVTPVTFRRYLSFLVERGWIQTRTNPQYKWDRTSQYRVNLRKLHNDLSALGYALPGFSNYDAFPSEPKGSFESDKFKNRQNSSTVKNDHSKLQDSSFDEEISFSPTQNPNQSTEVKNDHSKIQNSPLNGKLQNFEELKNDLSNRKLLSSRIEKNLTCNTEITTENTSKITNREHTQRTRVRKSFDKNCFEEILGIWKTCTSQEGLVPVHITEERKQRLQSVLATHFQNDLSQWKQFCEQVGCSPFLMGHGARKWRVSLDWILCEENLIKVLEGNFDDPAGLDQKRADQSKSERAKEINTILASIEDPVWKKWCSQLDFSTESRDSVSLWELKEIANARFLEVENDRLVWIGSSEPRVLSRIEDLKLKILPFVQRIFPQARTLRTRLDETLPVDQPNTIDHPTISTKTTQQKGENHAE
jgi:hypothetical protein